MDHRPDESLKLNALFQTSIRSIRPAARASAAVNALLWAPIAAVGTLYFNGIVPAAFSRFASGAEASPRDLLMTYGTSLLAFGISFILALLANCASTRIVRSAMAGEAENGRRALSWAFRERFGAVLLLAVLETLAYLLLFLAASAIGLLLSRVLGASAAVAASTALLILFAALAAALNVLLSLSLPALASGGLGPLAAMAASIRLVRGAFWKTALASFLWYLGLGSLVLTFTMPLSWIALAPFNAVLADAMVGTSEPAAIISAMGRAYGSLGLGFGVYLWAAGILAGILRVPFKTTLYEALRARSEGNRLDPPPSSNGAPPS